MNDRITDHVETLERELQNMSWIVVRLAADADNVGYQILDVCDSFEEAQRAADEYLAMRYMDPVATWNQVIGSVWNSNPIKEGGYLRIHKFKRNNWLGHRRESGQWQIRAQARIT